MQTETSFQRANRLADAAKAKQWRAYRAKDPLPKSAFDDFERVLRPILVDIRNASSMRSTIEGRVFSHLYMRLRPTEDAAFIRARGEDKLNYLVVIRQEPATERRYCYGCKTRHAVSEFDRDKRVPSGISFYCRRARRELQHGVYRKAA